MLVFAAELQIVRTTCMYVEGWKKHWKIQFYGIYSKMKQLGHTVIKMKPTCHEGGSAQHPLSKASVRNFNSATRLPLTLGTFTTLWDASLRSKSFKSCFCSSSFSRRPSFYARWGMHSAKLENHLKFSP